MPLRRPWSAPNSPNRSATSRCRCRTCPSSTNSCPTERRAMIEASKLLLKVNLKNLRLPAMHAEFEALAREAATANENYEQYLLRLTELEVAARSVNVLKSRIKQAAFPAAKDFDTFDFTAQPSVNKPKILELANGEW